MVFGRHRDNRAAVRSAINEAQRAELTEGFAHGRARHVEALREGNFIETFTGLNSPRDDFVRDCANHLIDGGAVPDQLMTALLL